MVLIDVKWTLISDFDFHQFVLSSGTEEPPRRRLLSIHIF